MQQFINENDQYRQFLVNGQQQENPTIYATFRGLQKWDKEWGQMESNNGNNSTTVDKCNSRYKLTARPRTIETLRILIACPSLADINYSKIKPSVTRYTLAVDLRHHGSCRSPGAPCPEH